MEPMRSLLNFPIKHLPNNFNSRCFQHRHRFTKPPQLFQIDFWFYRPRIRRHHVDHRLRVLGDDNCFALPRDFDNGVKLSFGFGNAETAYGVLKRKF